jgi:radical SAM superfamily enzyme YgiQ (UPF0313 family)
MTEANFGPVFIGIESPDEDALRGARKHQNVKSPLEESVRAMNANGLTVIGSFIIGFDNEKKGAGKRIAEFVKKTNIPIVMLHLLRAIPGTSMWDRLKKENRLIKEEMDGLLTFGEPNFLYSRPQSEVIREFIDLTDQVYEPKAFLKRSYNYYLNMRPTRKALANNAGDNYSEIPQEKPAHGEIIGTLLAFLRVVWRQGVVDDCRFLFWKQLFGIYFKNPSRLHTYLLSIGLGENLFKIREMMKQGKAKSSEAQGS